MQVSGVEVPHHLYAAPEVLASGRASPASDVFSFGIVCFELACQRLASEHIAAVAQHRHHLLQERTQMTTTTGGGGVQHGELALSELPPSDLFALHAPFSTSAFAGRQHQATSRTDSLAHNQQLSAVQLQTEEGFARLVAKCLALEPSQRPTFAELVPQLYDMWHTLVRQVNPDL
jgi:serine/threonine protein kinase